ncbi:MULTISPECIES: hypothetical protein [Arthrobacter]|uniref:Uncharacterized protein n=1 Tax=Arthrobacter terricola TaxID=2547396 RepID=A0A4R5K9K0_9MICC|nr:MULTISPECIES: hypothetical protein [Arthrobacter]MBT8162934.1 hypothetical protein [Arthrobacter sp. GN70]TDF91656.1 hypothetical protein E1809_20260 [Arthrobacter terricola]
MTFTVTNQKPVVLDAVHTITCTGDYDPMAAIGRTIVEPLLTPLNPASPAAIADATGRALGPADITDLLLACAGDTIDAAAEQSMKELLGQTLVNFDQTTPLPVGELFAAQAGRRHKLPAPVPGKVVYTAREDVIPAAKALLSGTSDAGQFFASLAFAYHPDTLGFWFETGTVFDDFKTWLAQQAQMIGPALPAATTKLLGDFAGLSLQGLTESLLLRQDDSDNNEELSFARLIVHMLMQFLQQQRARSQAAGTQIIAGVLPFTVGELFCPKSLVFVNAEAHARARPNKVTAEWGIINQSLASPVKVLSHRNLSKLTAMHRATARAQAQAVAQARNAGRPTSRSAQVVFRKQPPTKVDLFSALTRVLKRMGKVNRSQNIFRKSRTTFLKANRRDPDDFNKAGRITSVSYMPDLHVYVDTSGSITEANYQEAVLMLIKIAKKLNVNLYFNSFSHVLSQETLLRVENKSITQIWQEFRKVPKVDGGTDYLQIWNYINASAVRRRRLSLVITDFEWRVPGTREDHPKNLYYAPCSAMDWNSMVRSAKHFAKAMKHIDPAIAQRLLGMIV